MPAAADRQRKAEASTSGGDFEIVFEQRDDGSRSPSVRSRSSTGCDWSTVEYSDSTYGSPQDGYGQPPSPEHELYLIFCDGNYVTTRWLAPADVGEQSIQPIIDRAVRQVLIDGIRVASRPNGEGITGIPSLFWVEGYDGQPITVTEEAFGIAVTVSATLQSVEWDFGDDTPKKRAGLGEAWPERSSVRHNYSHRSPPGEPYVVTASLVLDASFSVDGNAATPLPSITRLGQMELAVGEVQAVRNR